MRQSKFPDLSDTAVLRIIIVAGALHYSLPTRQNGGEKK